MFEFEMLSWMVSAGGDKKKWPRNGIVWHEIVSANRDKTLTYGRK